MLTQSSMEVEGRNSKKNSILNLQALFSASRPLKPHLAWAQRTNKTGALWISKRKNRKLMTVMSSITSRKFQLHKRHNLLSLSRHLVVALIMRCHSSSITSHNRLHKWLRLRWFLHHQIKQQAPHQPRCYSEVKTLLCSSSSSSSLGMTASTHSSTRQRKRSKSNLWERPSLYSEVKARLVKLPL